MAFPPSPLLLLLLFLAFAAVLISLFVTVHRKINFLVNLYWDNKYSDSDSDFVSFSVDRDLRRCASHCWLVNRSLIDENNGLL